MNSQGHDRTLRGYVKTYALVAADRSSGGDGIGCSWKPTTTGIGQRILRSCGRRTCVVADTTEAATVVDGVRTRRQSSQGVKPVEWVLRRMWAANEEQAWRQVNWYEGRWVLEEYHKAQNRLCHSGVQFTSSQALEPMIALRWWWPSPY